jgi:hypothetical protein
MPPSILSFLLSSLVVFLCSDRGRLWIDQLHWCVVWTFTRQPALDPVVRPEPPPTPLTRDAGRRVDTITAEQEQWLRRQLAALASELRLDHPE